MSTIMVKQPNGKFADFTTAFNDFAPMNMGATGESAHADADS